MLRADDVQVTFSRGGFGRQKIRALAGFSLEVTQGDIFGLLGPNGAGKSTAMYCFLGLIRPDSGHVTLMGQRPEQGCPAFDRIAYLPEEPHYHAFLTVDEMIRYYCSLHDKTIPTDEVEAAMERTGVSEFRNVRMEKCSKGMKQQAGLLLCYVTHPDLVFLDEPTRGLDPVAVRRFREILLAMNGRGTTFLINSHVLSEVEQLCNRVAIMNRGRVVTQDTVANLLVAHAEAYTAETSEFAEAPDFVSLLEKTPGRIRCRFSRDRLQEFLGFLREQGLTLLDCRLDRLSLEEAFLQKIEEAPRG
jgi:ABC-2 type transport system ATP-binding protein